MCLILSSATTSRADNEQVSPVESVGRVAILPLGNLTESDTYYQLTVDGVQRTLEDLGIDFISSEEVRPVLREFRIRSRGKISQVDASLLKEKLGIDLVLSGSIDLLREADIPEFSLSLRLISPDEITIRAAVTVSASGRDYTRLFDVGTIEDISQLIGLISRDAVERLFERLQSKNVANTQPDKRWAVLAFDNGSKNRHAGQILANWLISDLVTSGYQIVEPGSIDRLFRSNGGEAIGGIDSRRARLIYDSLGITCIITGEVDKFSPAIGLLETSVPGLAFGARVSDSRSDLVVASFECTTDGDDYESILGMGRYHSIGKLANRTFDNMRKWLENSTINYGVK